MAVPSTITDLSVVANSNSPAGTDAIGQNLDDFLRAGFSILRREQAQGTAIASASTTSIGANTDGNYLHITGTTTITSFGTVSAGVSRIVVFDGSLTLTHNSTSLILPGSASILTSAGDIAEFVSEGSGNWRCTRYQRSTGLAGTESGLVGQMTNARMSIPIASATAAFTADEIFVAQSLGGPGHRLANFSATINLGINGAGGVDTGGAPVNGFVALYAIYNPATGVKSILARNCTSALATMVYSGANMPSGYTDSALIAVVPTDGAGKLKVGYLIGRRFCIPNTNVLNTGSGTGSLTLLSISSVVPLNALTIEGYCVVANNAVSTTTLILAADTNGTGTRVFQTLNNAGGYSQCSPYGDLMITTAQSLYYNASATAGSPNYTIAITGYTF